MHWKENEFFQMIAVIKTDTPLLNSNIEQRKFEEIERNS